MTASQLEFAARRYCRDTAQDPDEMVPHGAEPNEYGIAYAVLLHTPRWQLVAKRLQDIYTANEAIRLALGQEVTT